MKRLIVLAVFFLAFGVLPLVVGAEDKKSVGFEPAQISEEPVVEIDILKTVVGQVNLYASRVNFPKDLESLFAGRDEKLQTGRKPKLIDVSGTFDGDFKVLVTENESPDLARYEFRIPVPTVIIEYTTKANWKARRYGNVNASFTGDDYLEVPSAGSAFDSFSLDSVLLDTNTSHPISITKIVAKRKSNEALLTGTFKKGSALGRFRLKFTP
jgi:hypothetical protein